MEKTFSQKFIAGVKFVVLGLFVIHVILFILLNLTAEVSPKLHLIYKSYDKPNFLFVMLSTSIISIFGWWLFRTSYKTLRQLSASQTRSQTAKLERDVAEMKAKAGMLQTKPGGVTVQVDKLGGGN